MSSTPPPESTTPANRSCAAAACSMPACALERAASASAVSAARRTCTRETAASAASDPRSATSVLANGLRTRCAANSTPTNSSSTSSGVPQIARSPSSSTAASISAVCS